MMVSLVDIRQSSRHRIHLNDEAVGILDFKQEVASPFQTYTIVYSSFFIVKLEYVRLLTGGALRIRHTPPTITNRRRSTKTVPTQQNRGLSQPYCKANE